MHRRGFHIILFILLLSSTSVDGRQAQQTTAYSFEFRGETLSQALDQIAYAAEIDLVYDPVLISGIRVYQRFRDETLQELLKKLLQDQYLDYITLSSGTFVIVKKAEGNPSFGTFSGRVVDSQTGEPLPGATVMLADASGGTSTNHSGNFSLNRMMGGSYNIIFSYVGYEPVYKTIHIPPDQQIREKVALERKPVDVLPVVVESHRSLMPDQRSGSVVNTDRDWEPAGSSRDAIRNLSLISGVQYGLPMNDLHLQGGRRGDHRILLDGVPVYNPYSFGQMFSSFSPYAIGNVELYKAGYGVKQGSQIAGLINLVHDVPVTNRNSAIFQADPLSFNLRADVNVPVSQDSPLKIMTALRTNFWNLYKDPALERTLRDWDFVDPLITNMVADLEQDASVYTPLYHDSDVQFFDFHFAADYKPDPYSSLSASVYLAENSMGTELLSGTDAEYSAPPYLFAGDSYEWENFMGQAKWNRLVSPRFDFSAQASFTANRFRHRNIIGTADVPYFFESNLPYAGLMDGYTRSVWLPTQIDGNRIDHFIFSTDGDYSFSPRFSLQGGLQMDLVSSGVDISDLAYQPTNTSETSAFFSSFLKGNYVFGSWWNIGLGTRLTSAGGTIYAEPRASVQFDRSEPGAMYWSARFSGGIYRQFIHQYEITNAGPASLVPEFPIWSHSANSEIPKAYHVSGSLLMEPLENTTLNVESFYKRQPNAPVTSYTKLLTENEIDRNKVSAFAEFTEMKTFGVSVRLNRELEKPGLKLVAGYDYTFSRIDLTSQFGRSLPAPWNEPHRVQFRSLWKVWPDVKISAKWQGIWGRTWAFRQSYYNFLRFREREPAGGFNFDNPGSDKLSPFHQVDLSIIYQPSAGVADLEFRLELINLLNRRNTIDRTLFPTGNEGNPFRVRNRNLPGFYPSASFQVKL